MRVLILATAFLLAAAAPSLAAKPPTYREVSESMGELATLNGRPVRFVDIEAEWTLPEFMRPRNLNTTKPLIRERAINGLRKIALDELAPVLMPDCPVEPTAAELEAYYPYWRAAVAQEIVRRDKAGIKEGQGDELFAKAGMKVPPSVPLAEMAKVDSGTPGADARARAAIRGWKLDHCLQKTFGGDRFFGASIIPTYPWTAEGQMIFMVDGDQRSLLVPSQGLEALTARGRFFRLAESRGLISFRQPKDAAYFFERYEGGLYDNVKEDAVAMSFLSTAPWASTPP